MKLFKNCLFAGMTALALLGAAKITTAQETDQVGRSTYLEALKGKKVIFVPISQGMDLNQAWVVVWQRHAARY
ncbi:sugar ABC transporter substrate-binding protein, partial [Mesorhizobium sp. M7A.F.Ca.MR.362.00.0.0]